MGVSGGRLGIPACSTEKNLGNHVRSRRLTSPCCHPMQLGGSARVGLQAGRHGLSRTTRSHASSGPPWRRLVADSLPAAFPRLCAMSSGASPSCAARSMSCMLQRCFGSTPAGASSPTTLVAPTPQRRTMLAMGRASRSGRYLGFVLGAESLATRWAAVRAKFLARAAHMKSLGFHFRLPTQSPWSCRWPGTAFMQYVAVLAWRSCCIASTPRWGRRHGCAQDARLVEPQSCVRPPGHIDQTAARCQCTSASTSNRRPPS